VFAVPPWYRFKEGVKRRIIGRSSLIGADDEMLHIADIDNEATGLTAGR
jgi:hypothetical protein